MRTFGHTLGYLAAITALLWVGLQPQFIDSGTAVNKNVMTSSFAQPEGMPDINAIFDQMNAQRAAQGLHPLERNRELAGVAQRRATDMNALGYYAHQSPYGEHFYDLLDPVAYKGVYACENLDLQPTLDIDVYVHDWLNSKKGHRECALSSKTTEAGYAVATVKLPKAKKGQTLYVIVAIHAAPANQAL